jgi:hypothetical protein
MGTLAPRLASSRCWWLALHVERQCMRLLLAPVCLRTPHGAVMVLPDMHKGPNIAEGRLPVDGKESAGL